MKLDPSLSAAENARAVLPKMARKYFESGRSIMGGQKQVEQLHAFRLKTKRFRYTLELFRPLYGPSLDRYLKALRTLQGALGQVSDYQTVRRMLSTDGELKVQIDRALKLKLRELRQQWRAFDANGQLKRWRRYLAGEHSKPRTKRSTASAVKRPAPVRKVTTKPAKKGVAQVAQLHSEHGARRVP